MGVDAIEAGASIGVAMEAGILPFGDAEGAFSLLEQVGEGTPLGRIIGNGVVATGRLLGVRRIRIDRRIYPVDLSIDLLKTRPQIKVRFDGKQSRTKPPNGLRNIRMGSKVKFRV